MARQARTTKPAPAQPRRARKRRLSMIGILTWPIRALLRLVWYVTWRATLVGVLGLSVWVGYYYMRLPAMEQLLDGRTRGSVLLLDNGGAVFAWRGDQYDGTLRAQTISPHLRHAVIATEDRRFYQHFGVSPRGIAGAIAINLRAGRGPLSGHGGSTITQQVAKLLCLGEPFDRSAQTEAEYEAECRRSSLWRKLQEIPFALAMELRYEKNDILSIYLNRAYLGAGAYGFEAASSRYFGISARDLNPAQAAMLAGLLTAPSRYAPTGNLTRAQERAATVVRLMREQGYLSEIEAQIAATNPATLSSGAQDPAGSYFADWIMSVAPDYLTRATTEDVEILTTFDPAIQAAAEAALAHVFETRVREGSNAQAAIVVMSPDGAVRAMVGGRDPNPQGGGFNRAAQARRQPGSAFKPIIYAAALESGFMPNFVMEDEPITINVPGSGPWSPQNYSREFLGPITLTEALARSVNTVAVQLSEQVGRERVRAMAMDFGLNSPIAEGPALALGVSEVTLLELTGAYAGFLNGGRRTLPYGWLHLRLTDNSFEWQAERERGIEILSEESSGYLVYMLHQVVEQGSGGRARIEGWEIAGKTGTAQEAKDAWFIGFSSEYVVGVWMGYDDNTPLTGVTGSGLPAEIFREVMVRVLAGRSPRPLPIWVPPDPQPIGQGPAADWQEYDYESIPAELFGTPMPLPGGTGGNGGGNDRPRTVLELLLGTPR